MNLRDGVLPLAARFKPAVTRLDGWCARWYLLSASAAMKFALNRPGPGDDDFYFESWSGSLFF